MKKVYASKLALSSILTALALITLWLSSVLNTGTLALLAISTCFSVIVFTDCGKKYGFMHYAAVSLLALLLIPKGAQFIAYIMFLGYYPFIRQKVKSLSLRAVIFTFIYALSFMLFKSLLLPGLSLKMYHYVLGLILGEIVFFIFDYAILQFIIFYKGRFSFFKN